MPAAGTAAAAAAKGWRQHRVCAGTCTASPNCTAGAPRPTPHTPHPTHAPPIHTFKSHYPTLHTHMLAVVAPLLPVRAVARRSFGDGDHVQVANAAVVRNNTQRGVQRRAYIRERACLAKKHAGSLCEHRGLRRHQRNRPACPGPRGSTSAPTAIRVHGGTAGGERSVRTPVGGWCRGCTCAHSLTDPGILTSQAW